MRRRRITRRPTRGESIFGGIVACIMGCFGLFVMPIGFDPAITAFTVLWCLLAFGMGIYNFLVAAGKVRMGGYEITVEDAPTPRGASTQFRRHEPRDAAAEQAREHAAERRHSEKRWAEARRQQADALRVHAAGVDSCEGRLESLKVLYDAGILDRDEYLQRVERVKSRPAHI